MNAKAYHDYAKEHPEEAKKAQEQFQAILRRSATDWDFRQALLNDPAAAVAEFTGEETPDSFDLVFVENKADATIVLPDYVDPDGELSDDDLEAVSGGDVLLVGTVILVAGAAAWAGYKVGHLIEEALD